MEEAWRHGDLGQLGAKTMRTDSPLVGSLLLAVNQRVLSWMRGEEALP